MEKQSLRCRVNIMREPGVCCGGREMGIFVDNIRVSSIGNGKTLIFYIDPGPHVLNFSVGRNFGDEISISFTPDNDVNIICHVKNSGKIEASLTSADMSSLSVPIQSIAPKSSGGGCLPVAIGLILFLAGIWILGVKLNFFVYLVPIV